MAPNRAKVGNKPKSAPIEQTSSKRWSIDQRSLLFEIIFFSVLTSSSITNRKRWKNEIKEKNIVLKWKFLKYLKRWFWLANVTLNTNLLFKIHIGSITCKFFMSLIQFIMKFYNFLQLFLLIPHRIWLTRFGMLRCDVVLPGRCQTGFNV